MTTRKGLANPTLEINDEVVAYKPNSLSANDGGGEIVVRPQTAGGGALDNVVTEDVETRKSKIKVTLLAEKTNIERKNKWVIQSREAGGVVIRLSEEGYSRAFRGMRVIKDPDYAFGSEGEFEIEFEGDPAT